MRRQPSSLRPLTQGSAGSRWRWRLRRWLRSLGALCILLAMAWAVWAGPRPGDGAWRAPWEDAPPLTADGRPLRAIDGDSIAVGQGTAQVEIRLAGIDAPEYRQTCRAAAGAEWPCGVQARAALASLIARDAQFACTATARDKYGRTLAHCRTATTPDIGAALVRGGWAIAYPGHGSDDRYEDAEFAARTARVGVWQGPFDAPADWRAQHAVDSGAIRLHD